MNFWIRRNHKRQSDSILNHLRTCSPYIKFGLNLYSRGSHSIEVICHNMSFLVVRLGRNWFLRMNGATHTLQPYGTAEFWNELSQTALYYHQLPLKQQA